MTHTFESVHSCHGLPAMWPPYGQQDQIQEHAQVADRAPLRGRQLQPTLKMDPSGTFILVGIRGALRM